MPELCLAKEGVERVIAGANGLVGRHLSIWLDTVLEAVEFPASVADLDTSLSNMKRDAFTHFRLVNKTNGGNDRQQMRMNETEVVFREGIVQNKKRAMEGEGMEGENGPGGLKPKRW